MSAEQFAAVSTFCLGCGAKVNKRFTGEHAGKVLFDWPRKLWDNMANSCLRVSTGSLLMLPVLPIYVAPPRLFRSSLGTVGRSFRGSDLPPASHCLIMIGPERREGGEWGIGH